MDKLIVDLKVFYAAHPWLCTPVVALVVLWFLATVVSFTTYKESQAEWTQYCKDHPVRAYWIRVARAFGTYAIKLWIARFPWAGALVPPTDPPTEKKP